MCRVLCAVWATGSAATLKWPAQHMEPGPSASHTMQRRLDSLYSSVITRTERIQMPVSPDRDPQAQSSPPIQIQTRGFEGFLANVSGEPEGDILPLATSSLYSLIHPAPKLLAPSWIYLLRSVNLPLALPQKHSTTVQKV